MCTCWESRNPEGSLIRCCYCSSLQLLAPAGSQRSCCGHHDELWEEAEDRLWLQLQGVVVIDREQAATVSRTRWRRRRNSWSSASQWLRPSSQKRKRTGTRSFNPNSLLLHQTSCSRNCKGVWAAVASSVTPETCRLQKTHNVLLFLVTQISPLDRAKITRKKGNK